MPPKFAKLEYLLQEMPKKTVSGSAGLLAEEGRIAEASERVPLFSVDGIEDSATLTALFRDYTFWASAYLLEPCDFWFKRTGQYGLGRDRLPQNIAVPLAKISAKIGAAPFMEYAQSYALYNWKRRDPGNKSLDFENLELIRAFENSEHEAGFILVHVAMVAHSNKLVEGVLQVLEAAQENNAQAINSGFDLVISTMKEINGVMETMWVRSSAAAYNSFRAYIMGTKSQPMFPRGVVYEGVSAEPRYYRGESGANDTIIPTCDNLLQLTERMPKNPLTEILMDFRKYRPLKHNEWLRFVEDAAGATRVARVSLSRADSSVRYLALLDQVREFRDRHWRFTKEYILKYSSHPVATGGSPIVTWLPNQLSTVLEAIVRISREAVPNPKDQIHDLKLRQMYEDITANAVAQERILKRELEDLKAKYPLDHQAVSY